MGWSNGRDDRSRSRGVAERPVASAVALALALSAASGCGETARRDASGRSAEELAAELRALGTPAGLTSAAPAPLAERPVAGADPQVSAPAYSTEGGRPVRTTVTLTRYAASATYDTQVLLNPASDVIYPGSVLVGSSIADGSYREVVTGEKNDITVSYGGLNGVTGLDGRPGVVSGTIHPSLSSFRTLHNAVMGQRLHGASSTYTLQATDASTAESFDVHVAAGVSFASPAVTAAIKGNFDYTKASSRNRYLIRFAQTFYTVDVDQGAAFLYRSYALGAFQGARPVFVSSVAYGRLAFITLESSESIETIAAGIGLILDTPALAVDTSASTSVRAVQNASNLAITVIGSDRVVTTLPAFKDLLENGGFSATNTGQIVSYKLRFVDDGSVASTVYAGEYTLRSASRTTGAWDVAVQADGILFADTDGSRVADSVDLMGRLVVDHGAQTYTLWERPRSNLGIYPDDATTFTDLTGETAPVRFTASSLDDPLRFRTVDIWDYNPQDKSVPYGPADESFSIDRALADGGAIVTAKRSDGQVNRWVKLRVKVAATAAF